MVRADSPYGGLAKAVKPGNGFLNSVKAVTRPKELKALVAPSGLIELLNGLFLNYWGSRYTDPVPVQLRTDR